MLGLVRNRRAMLCYGACPLLADTGVGLKCGHSMLTRADISTISTFTEN